MQGLHPACSQQRHNGGKIKGYKQPVFELRRTTRK